jgi:hypothetical protein
VGSFVVHNLRCFYEEHWSEGDGRFDAKAAADKYLKVVAGSLGVPPEKMLEFLAHGQVASLITQYLPDHLGVLIEATYRVNGVSVEVTRVKDEAGNVVAQISPTAAKDVFASQNRQIESMRLRCRIGDVTNEDKTRFAVGFRILGNGFSIKLQTVDRAGSEGIFDLATVFLHDDLKAAVRKIDVQHLKITGVGDIRLHGFSPPAEDTSPAYERAVPAAVLFCQ